MTAPLDARHILRGVHVARLSLAAAIYLAALFVWLTTDESSTLLASLALVGAMGFTAASVIYTEVYRRPAGRTFLYLQALFDLGLVTTVVQVTGGASSGFAALYILVTAEAALLLPARGVVLVAALGIAVYVATAVMTPGGERDLRFWLRVGVFAWVAAGCGYVSVKLREQSSGQEALAAELAQFRLQKADLEELRSRARKLEAVAELSASLAHEIRNPLSAIRSAVEQLGDSPRSNDDERALSSLVQRESDRLSRLLSDFIDFARLDAARWAPVDAIEVTSGAVSLAESHPDKPEGVTINVVLPRTPVVVDGDSDLLHRALFNLLLNAMQASPPGGTIFVEAAELSPRQTPIDGAPFLSGGLAIRISDEGGGIPEDLRKRMFDPFVSTKRGGTGLGLAVVQRAITAHKGLVLVDSTARGTRFTVLLPRSANGVSNV
ncbi:MAG: two-component system sensor histidine kinase NtrB [Gemmatimonadaceae bacterium]